MRPMLIAAAALLAGTALLPTAASARPGFVTASLSLRAGPSLDFPAVDRIPAGARVNIHGCIRGYRWCDVSFAGDRGWIDGDELQLLYRGRRVLIVDYGPRIDFPIIGFNVGSYWGHYYRGRNFYGRRDYWESRYRGHGGHNVTVGRGHRDRTAAGRNAQRERGHAATVGAGVHGTMGHDRGRGPGEAARMGGHAAHGMRNRGSHTMGAAPSGRSGVHGAPSHGAATTGAAPAAGAAAHGAGGGGHGGGGGGHGGPGGGAGPAGGHGGGGHPAGGDH